MRVETIQSASGNLISPVHEYRRDQHHAAIGSRWCSVIVLSPLAVVASKGLLFGSAIEQLQPDAGVVHIIADSRAVFYDTHAECDPLRLSN